MGAIAGTWRLPGPSPEVLDRSGIAPMVLRPITEATAGGNAVVPAWPEIERTELDAEKLKEVWLIPQPAHSALSGDVASRLKKSEFPGIDDKLVRVIALHDAGWGPPDAAAIQTSRGGKDRSTPKCFLSQPESLLLDAWAGSINVTEKVNATGGYIVSRHFVAIAKARASHFKEQNRLVNFLRDEDKRQDRLAKKAGKEKEALERLVEALQFCDLLSLYLCCGSKAPVEFPQKVGGRPIQLEHKSDGHLQLDPNPLVGPQIFRVTAIRHPKGQQGSSALFDAVFD